MIRVSILSRKSERVLRTQHFEDGELESARKWGRGMIARAGGNFAVAWRCKDERGPSEEVIGEDLGGQRQ